MDNKCSTRGRRWMLQMRKARPQSKALLHIHSIGRTIVQSLQQRIPHRARMHHRTRTEMGRPVPARPNGGRLDQERQMARAELKRTMASTRSIPELQAVTRPSKGPARETYKQRPNPKPGGKTRARVQPMGSAC